MEVIRATDLIMEVMVGMQRVMVVMGRIEQVTEVMGRMERVMPLTLAMAPIQALSRSRFPIVPTTSMVLGIGAEGLITLGRQAIGDGVITTDIGTTVTTGFITDGFIKRSSSQ
jgi:hypothetical protein